MAVPRISSIAVTGLQGMFDYTIEFPRDRDTIILIAPNGYGKTALLSLLNACLQFRLLDAVNHTFEQLTLRFDDKSRWEFEKTPERHEQEGRAVRTLREYVGRRRLSHRVDFRLFDRRGRQTRHPLVGNPHNVPSEILARALDQSLPIFRTGPDSFRDVGSTDVISATEVVERYSAVLSQDETFRAALGQHSSSFFTPPVARPNPVFIETQRLLFSRRGSSTDDEKREPSEEIQRQAQQLARRLQLSNANYAATSQALDRSFPTRLIQRARYPHEISPADALRAKLNLIEKRRRDLTEAGILSESAQNVIDPDDELSPQISDALEIYVEDSEKKLATFDEIYRQVSVFKELLGKKLRPKDVVVNREGGVEVRRAAQGLELVGLSSGEKHEFIMLYKLIFETPPESLVLIDEPEISLHVVWQLEFMSDLQRIQSVNPFQSIIATHSPQIIQGSEHVTFDLSEQVQ